MQKSVGLYAAGAVAGDFASNNPKVFYPFNFLVASTGVKIGGFAWIDSDGNVVAAGTGAPAGFVYRDQDKRLNCFVEGSLDVQGGEAVGLLIKGDVYVVADKAVAAGDTVYANNTTGAVTFTATGATDSGYKALEAATSGALVCVSNWA